MKKWFRNLLLAIVLIAGMMFTGDAAEAADTEGKYYAPFTAKYDITNGTYTFDFTLDTEEDVYLAYYCGADKNLSSYDDIVYTTGKTASITMNAYQYNYVYLWVADADGKILAEVIPTYRGEAIEGASAIGETFSPWQPRFILDKEFHESIEFVNGNSLSDFDFGTVWDGAGKFTFNVPEVEFDSVHLEVYRDGEALQSLGKRYSALTPGGTGQMDYSWKILESGVYTFVYWIEGDGVRSKNQYVCEYNYVKPEEKIAAIKSFTWSEEKPGRFTIVLAEPEKTGWTGIRLEYKPEGSEEFIEIPEYCRTYSASYANGIQTVNYSAGLTDENAVYRIAVRAFSNNIDEYFHSDVVYSEIYDPNAPTAEEKVREFVERMYTVALDRDAEEDGAAWWTNELLNGTSDGAGLAQGFLKGGEFANKGYDNAKYVEVLYATFFNREIAEGEGDFWVNALESGTTRESVLSGFVNSEEFFNLCAEYGILRGVMLEDGTAVNAGIGKFAERL